MKLHFIRKCCQHPIKLFALQFSSANIFESENTALGYTFSITNSSAIENNVGARQYNSEINFTMVRNSSVKISTEIRKSLTSLDLLF